MARRATGAAREGRGDVSEIEEILKQVPMDQVAAALGLDPRAAEAATRVVIPALLGGMKANAADPAGAESLATAVAQHDASALGADLDQIDTKDGQRIVDNVFGEQTIAVVAHGGTIAAYLATVLDIHRSLWMTVENTSISVVRLHADGPTVVAVNDCHHLYDPVLGAS